MLASADMHTQDHVLVNKEMNLSIAQPSINRYKHTAEIHTVNPVARAVQHSNTPTASDINEHPETPDMHSPSR